MYWYRMRLKSPELREQAATLIEEHAIIERRLQRHHHWERPDILKEEEPSEVALLRACRGHLSQALSKLLEFEPKNMSREFPYRRESFPFEHIWFWPPEWDYTFSCHYLPDELPEQLARWRYFLRLAREGKCNLYLHERHCANKGNNLLDAWVALQALADEAQKKKSWARRWRLVGLAEEIKQIPMPVVPATPLWSAWYKRAEGEMPKRDERLKTMRDQHAQLLKIGHEWDEHAPYNARLKWGILSNYAYTPLTLSSYDFDDRGRVSRLLNWCLLTCREKQGWFANDLTWDDERLAYEIRGGHFVYLDEEVAFFHDEYEEYGWNNDEEEDYEDGDEDEEEEEEQFQATPEEIRRFLQGLGVPGEMGNEEDEDEDEDEDF